MLLLNLHVYQDNFSVDLISCISKALAVWVDTSVFRAACVKEEDKRTALAAGLCDFGSFEDSGELDILLVYILHLLLFV